jgi:hypothetical protein
MNIAVSFHTVHGCLLKTPCDEHEGRYRSQIMLQLRIPQNEAFCSSGSATLFHHALKIEVRSVNYLAKLY